MAFDLEALADRLYADALATGLRSPIAFCDVRTTTSWAQIEIYIRERARNHARDLSATAAQVERALEQVRDEWRKATKPDSSLREIDLLSCGARTLLQRNGREMILRADRENPGREILRWRFVSLALPPGILTTAATEKGFVAPKSVRLLNASMAPDSPVAQNHLHHASLPTFEDLWVSLRIRALTQPEDFARSIQAFRAYCPRLHRGTCPGDKTEEREFLRPTEEIARVKHMAEWADLIRQAFIARRVIDQHAWHRDALAYCAEPICQTARTILRAFVSGQTKPYSLCGTRYPWPEEREFLLREIRKSGASAVRRRLAGASPDLLLKEVNCERRILVRAFDLLRSQKRGDGEYEKMFMQYLRVKTAVFGLLVHSPGERGLNKFVQYFTQIKVYAHEANKLQPPKPVEPGLNVRATEYRVAPDAWLETLRHDPVIGELQEAAWIIHFQRKGPGTGLPLYGAERRSIQGQAESIASALAQKPARLKTLRGIDICGVEGKQPLWVSAQVLQWLRARSRDTAASRPGLKLEPLNLTLHAGEDFEWLTSGVRAVAEPFQWGLIERGDRIGHGIAVTLDPKGWWIRHKGEVKEVTSFDRLLDLAFLAKYSEQRSIEETAWLRREIESIVNGLWPNTRNKPDDLITSTIEVWLHLGCPTTRRLMESSNLRPNAPLHEQWIYKYLWDRGTRRRASKKVQMKVEGDENDSKSSSTIERNLLSKAREKLIPEIALWQVCLESNPSSNLVVASLDSMASQDFLQTRPTSVARKGAETLTWTISTDNPITFSTSLADEYAYAWAGMVLRKDRPYDPSYARALLDEAAATSMRMRFTTRYDSDGAARTNRPENADADRT
jgi:hypothetical protein